MRKHLYLRTSMVLGLIFAFLANTLFPMPLAQADEFFLPAPGRMVALSPAYDPAVLKGIKLDSQDPFRFHFFVDTGNSSVHQDLKEESNKLIKYFLASLAIPEKDLWVNLSPFEKDRIVPKEFGLTQMGRDLLAEDYILKQITASLIYPESQLGREFWQKVYTQAQAKYGTTDIPINTFNKVWIVPEKAVVYENGGTAFVLENHLKVMLESDYLAMKKDLPPGIDHQTKDDVAKQIIKEIVIPALTKEVNEGKNFAPLRQVFYSLILATWYKKKIKDSIINRIYSNRKKIQNLTSAQALTLDPQYIYQQYLQAFKKGVYNYIKDEPDLMSGQTVSKKYFSGGVNAIKMNAAMIIVDRAQVNKAAIATLSEKALIRVDGDMMVLRNSINNSMSVGGIGGDNTYRVEPIAPANKTKAYERPKGSDSLELSEDYLKIALLERLLRDFSRDNINKTQELFRQEGLEFKVSDATSGKEIYHVSMGSIVKTTFPDLVSRGLIEGNSFYSIEAATSHAEELKPEAKALIGAVLLIDRSMASKYRNQLIRFFPYNDYLDYLINETQSYFFSNILLNEIKKRKSSLTRRITALSVQQDKLRAQFNVFSMPFRDPARKHSSAEVELYYRRIMIIVSRSIDLAEHQLIPLLEEYQDIWDAKKHASIYKKAEMIGVIRSAVENARAFISGMSLLLNQNPSVTDFTHLYSRIKGLVFSYYYNVREGNFQISEHISDDLGNLTFKPSEELTFALFTLLQPFRNTHHLRLKISAHLETVHEDNFVIIDAISPNDLKDKRQEMVNKDPQVGEVWRQCARFTAAVGGHLKHIEDAHGWRGLELRLPLEKVNPLILNSNQAMDTDIQKSLDLVADPQQDDIATIHLLKNLELFEGDKVLSIGPAANVAHLIYGALKKARMDVVLGQSLDQNNAYIRTLDQAKEKGAQKGYLRFDPLIRTRLFPPSVQTKNEYDGVVMLDAATTPADQIQRDLQLAITHVKNDGILIINASVAKTLSRKEFSAELIDREGQLEALQIVKYQELVSRIAFRLGIEHITRQQLETYIQHHQNNDFPEEINEVDLYVTNSGLDEHLRNLIGRSKTLEILNHALLQMRNGSLRPNRIMLIPLLPPKNNPAQKTTQLIPGGIDLDPAQMSMQVRSEGENFRFNFKGTIINTAQVSGAIFNIRSITAVKDLPQLLGLNEV